MPDVHADILIDAPPQRVYTIAKNIERLPDFLPSVQQVIIREREGQRVVSEWTALVPEFKRTLHWVEEDVWDDAALVCTFRCLSGDWDRYQGTWTFSPENGRARVRLDISYEYNVPLIGPLIKQLLRKLVARNAEETLAGLQRQVAQET